MNTIQKSEILNRLLQQSESVKVRNSDHPDFKSWKNAVERALIKVFGIDSLEIQQFRELTFNYQAMAWNIDTDYSNEERECFERDFSILISSIKSYIEELQNDSDVKRKFGEFSQHDQIGKVFISHSSDDSQAVEELVDLLELIGLTRESIFCTSLAGYGIALGANFLEGIRKELNSNTLVLFVLSRKFYTSPVCLCEMGAAWVQTKEHIPILIPPFDFNEIDGVIPLTEGFKLNDKLKLNLFKEKIESTFRLPATLSPSVWERKRDKMIARINTQSEKPILQTDGLLPKGHVIEAKLEKVREAILLKLRPDRRISVIQLSRTISVSDQVCLYHLLALRDAGFVDSDDYPDDPDWDTGCSTYESSWAIREAGIEYLGNNGLLV